MLIILYFLASVTYSSCCCNAVCCYVCHQKVAIALGIDQGCAYFYIKNFAFPLFLNWIHSFVLKLVHTSSTGLVYARQDMLDINIL